MNFLQALFSPAYESITPQTAQAHLTEYYIIDVRQPDEYFAGHIADAQLLPLPQLMLKISSLPADQAILCVCRSGGRSGRAAAQLNRAGFKAVNLRGGMLAWEAANLPIKKGAG